MQSSALKSGYRGLVLWLAVQLVLGGVLMGLGSLAGESPLGLVLALAELATIVVSTIGLAYCGYRTAHALGSATPWLWGLAMLVPCMNIVTFVVLISKARQAAAASELSLGLGPTPGESDSRGSR